MTKAPESLYVEISQHPDEWTGTAEQVTEFDTEYTRTDTIPALLAAEREKALREALSEIGDCFITPDNDHDEGYFEGVRAAYVAVAARIDAPAPTCDTKSPETVPQTVLSRTSEPQEDKPSVQEAARYIHDLITSRMLPAKNGQAAIAALGIEQGVVK